MMKKQILLFTWLLLVAGAVLGQVPTVTTNPVDNIHATTAMGHGTVTNQGGSAVTERGICWSTTNNPNLSGNHAPASTGGVGSFSVNISGLQPNTTYYVRAYAINSSGTGFGGVLSFTTTSLPEVNTNPVDNISQTSATGHGTVISAGDGTTVTERGICWSTTNNPSLNGNHAAASTGGLGAFSRNITGLQPNTTYYVRAYAINNVGSIGYGGVMSFTTLPVALPTVTTSQVTNITQTAATGGGNVTNAGGGTVTARGVCWSTSHNPTINGSHAQASTGGTGTFTVNMTGLTPGTLYYVRAYATNSAGTAYGSEVSFTTPVALPTVTTSQVTNITQTTATGGGNVTNAGGGTVTARGVCWSTSHNPTINGNHAQAGSGTGSFTVNITGLTAGTLYYVRAYATNSAGTAYGNEVSFTTSPVVVPTVTTSQVTNITQTTATGGGNVTSDGGGTVTARGVCWSTSHNPTINGSHAQASTGGTGTFTVNMTGLTAGTTYYVRAYATNSAGTAYGSEVSFTTSPVVLPTVTTSQVTNITQTTATGGGNVTTDGGGTVSARGVCWSTSHNPTINGSHAQAGSGTGSFTVNMTGLTPGTLYYVRAYATNSAGTAYGSEVSFTTSSVVMPTVTTLQVTNITQTSATASANVTSAGGGTVTARGVCWSTSHNPTISGSHAQAGSGTGTFTVSITGLSPGTTYYVRAYATNSAGTAYSSEVSFTTLVGLPSVTNLQVTNITRTSATASANVTSSGGGTVTARGVCWSTSHNPTVSGSHAQASTGGLGNFSVNMTSLTPGTTYYVRAYATNSAGTAYGSEVSFTTLPITAPTVITSQVTNITEHSATGGGNVTDDGGATVTERGICWSTNNNPTINGNNAHASSSGLGEYSINMSDLIPETKYYVKAYAINSMGISYGEEKSFRTSVLPQYEITVVADPQEGGEVSGGDTYQEGQTCTLTASAHNGFEFEKWDKNGIDIEEPDSFSFNVTAAATYTAHFRTLTYTVSVTANPTEGGTVSSNGETFTYGQECMVTAVANEGYTFTNWTENGNVVSSESPYHFSVERDYNLVANFATTTFNIQASTLPTEGGSVTGAGVYALDDLCRLTAMANEGYKFVNWTENGEIQCETEQYEFIVRNDRTLVANFEVALTEYVISAMAGEHGSISPLGEVRVLQGNSQTFTMTPDNGYGILKVIVDGEDKGPIETYTFENVNSGHYILVTFSGMGVEEVEDLKINVYPNPTKGMVYVEGDGIESLELYDMRGNCLRSIAYHDGRALNVSDLPQGPYVLLIKTQDGRSGYKIIMVTH